MTLAAILAIAVALAMDAFAVTLTCGARMTRVSLTQTLRMAGTFGAFQFFMPLIGWLLGSHAQHYIEEYDHWLAFGLLAFVGYRMIREAWEHKKDAESCTDSTKAGSLLLLGIATSLDALAVGLSLALIGENVWYPAMIIGVVCFLLSVVGLHLGHTVRRLSGLGDKANVLGGLVLWGIGFKILHEHGVFS